MDVNVEQAWLQFRSALGDVASAFDGALIETSDNLEVHDIEMIKKLLIASAIFFTDLHTFEQGDVPNAAYRAVEELRSNLWIEDD